MCRFLSINIVFSLSFDFLFSSLFYGKNAVYNAHNIQNMLTDFMLSVGLLAYKRLLVVKFWEESKLCVDFQLCGGCCL